jgi:ketosteroid isomerase-like protein
MDPATERERLLTRDAEWASMSTEGKDIDGIVSYWSEDAVLYQAGMPPVVGKNALREYVTASLAIPGFVIEWQADDAFVSDDCSMAYMTGTNQVSMDGEDGATQVLPGHFVTVWRRGAADEWLCVVDALIAAP